VGPLIRFGGWMTVSNVVGPIMVYMDRFLIGAFVSVAAVAYYTTPYEVITKLWLIPGAVVGVLFPAFAASYVGDRQRSATLFSWGTKCVLLALIPIVLGAVTLAPEAMDFWLGGEFARQGTGVLRWLAVGILLNSLSYIPFALVQGAGRPDLTARLHLLELPFYLLAIWWLIHLYGIQGAAIAWAARVGLDACILFALAMRVLPEAIPTIRRLGLVAIGAIGLLSLAVFPLSFAARAVFLVFALGGSGLATWFFVLSPEERSKVHEHLKFVQAVSTNQ